MSPIKSTSSEIQIFLDSLRPSLTLFTQNDPLRLAGATAFFTTFALPPIVFILARLFGFLIGQRNMGKGLMERISFTLGEEGAGQVRQVLMSIRGFSNEWYVTVFGFIFLLFVATSLFSVIKSSMNQLWQVRVKEKPGILFIVSSRLRSFAVIMLAGLLFLIDLLFESLEVIAGNYIGMIWKEGEMYFTGLISTFVSIIVVSCWFILLFRFVADARPSWKAAIVGGLLTGVLFAAGRLLLRTLLVNSNISSMYGVSGSFVLVLLFVFYSSFILYYGACFVAVYSAKKDWAIKLTDKAYSYRISKI